MVLARAAYLTIPYPSERGVIRFQKQLYATDFERIRFTKTDLSQATAVEQLINDLGEWMFLFTSLAV